ncbi:hypothetical protein AC578_6329 [Pseudocercospora eumusae]|uniref:Uncharacterized protein n=1 Tax=Pseudocercospora eumusae TaxID=321146 RepID=A0A139HGG5_9PEZI|nr:hypothetical protein AC578_6329 [Pseudocercospora eumusae]
MSPFLTSVAMTATADMNPGSPPSYEEASQGRRSIPIIVQLQQYQPGRLIEDHLMSSGKLATVKADAILLPHSITHSEIIRFLHRRVVDRSGMRAPSKDLRFFCRLGLDVDDEQVLLDHGSWKAAKDLLGKREDVKLKFMFSIVSVKYTGMEFGERMVRRLRGLEYGQICLVEPSLPNDEGSE